MLRRSSSTSSTRLLGEQRIASAPRAAAASRLSLGQVGLDTMEEQRRLVEQALGRTYVLDDHRLRQPVQLGVLRARQLAPRVDDDRACGACRAAALMRVDQLEAGHARQPQVEHDAVEAALCASASASSPLPTAVVTTSPSPISSMMLSRCTASSSTTSSWLHPLLEETRQLLERAVNGLPRDRLLQERERAVLQRAPLARRGRDDVDRDVARRRVVLELIEQHPAVDVGQAQIERDRVGPQRARELERLR